MRLRYVDDIDQILAAEREARRALRSEAINLEFERPMSVAEVRQILSKAPGVKIVDDPANNHFPMPLEASGDLDVHVGRIRADLSNPNGLVLWVAGDQLLKAAGIEAAPTTAIRDLATARGKTPIDVAKIIVGEDGTVPSPSRPSVYSNESFARRAPTTVSWFTPMIRQQRSSAGASPSRTRRASSSRTSFTTNPVLLEVLPSVDSATCIGVVERALE